MSDMYGLVNRAIQEFVTSEFGADTWESIRTEAAVDTREFHGMEEYPDTVTYALVGAASKQLSLAPEKILEAFGEYWVLYTGKAGYGDLLRMSGGDFVSFLQNLDLLHARIGRAYPSLQPPAFQCTDVTDGALLLHYRSGRPGLTPLVIGLVKGVGKMFNTAVEITLLSRTATDDNHDVFRVTFTSQSH